MSYYLQYRRYLLHQSAHARINYPIQIDYHLAHQSIASLISQFETRQFYPNTFSINQLGNLCWVISFDPCLLLVFKTFQFVQINLRRIH